MFYVKLRYFAIVLFLLHLKTPLIIGEQNTYFYVQQHLRAVSGHLSSIPAQSKMQCAFICNENEMCGIANYANENFVCELVQQGMGVSEIATETTGGWQMLG